MTVTCYLMGGLGNQLFQIFTTLAYAFEYNYKVVFPYNDTTPGSVLRYTFWNNLLYPLSIFTTKHKTHNLTNENLMDFEEIYKEPCHEYQQIPNYMKTDLLLYGYFQSYLYFDKHFATICKLLRLQKQKGIVYEKYINYFLNMNNEICSMHFRIGDYKNIQDCHPLMNIDYYKNAIKEVDDNRSVSKILYFCQEQDNDTVLSMVGELQYLYQHIEFVKVDDQIEDWEQMLLMSLCHHNIIANSSFSWWGAYFNETKNKMVCYPSKWFGPKLSDKNVSSMFPNDWLKIYI